MVKLVAAAAPTARWDGLTRGCAASAPLSARAAAATTAAAGRRRLKVNSSAPAGTRGRNAQLAHALIAEGGFKKDTHGNPLTDPQRVLTTFLGQSIKKHQALIDQAGVLVD
eukprot:COSAG06_NODE_5839_length_3249_cov_16.365079_4_plen_111_part_00